MPDMFDTQKRRQIMVSNRSKNTAPELIVFKYLRRNKVYFKPHYSRVNGNPDIALPRKKKAVFIDGDFWHGRLLARVRASRGNTDYWTKKIEGNMQRDIKNRKLLAQNGWQILTIWETDITRRQFQNITLIKIHNFLED